MGAGHELRAWGSQRLQIAFVAALLACFAALGLLSQAPPIMTSSQAPAPSPDRSYGELPISFAPAAPGSAADFTATTSAGAIALSSRGAEIVPAAKGAAPITVAVAGAAAARPVPLAKLPGVVNDLRGNDRSEWRRDVPTFARVRYADVLPGIAMDWHGTSGTLEYDFRVAPGADPSRIGLDYGGAPVHLTGAGALVVGRGADAIRQAAPVAYQRIDGARVPVDVAFTLDGRHAGFVLGAYDRSKPLVIDPLVLTYSTFLGSGSEYDTVLDMAVDSGGNAYLTGYTGTFSGPDPAPAFPTTPGAYSSTRGGRFDAFVTKLNPSGTAAVYSTLLGGSDTEQGNGIAVDSSGNAYVTGYSYSSTDSGGTSFPVTAGAYQTATHGGWTDVFVTKLNAAGNGLVYSSYFGGFRTSDEARAIALDSTGAAWITGSTGAFDDAGDNRGAYPITGGGTGDPGDKSTPDMLVTKLNPAGSALTYSTYLGGDNQDEGSDIDVDSSDRAFITGFTTSYDDAPNGKEAMPFLNQYEGKTGGSSPSNADAYVARFSSAGALQYASAIGGVGLDSANAIAADNSGGAYITGSSQDGPPGFDEKNAYETYNGYCCYHEDAFVSKFDTGASGANSLVYSTLLGGDGGAEAGLAIDVDSTGAAYVGGATDSGVGNPAFPGAGPDFDVTSDRLSGTGGSAFVTKFTPAGNSLAWSTTIPNGSSSAVDTIYGLQADEANNAVYFGGTSTGNAASFHPTTPGAFQTTAPGGTWDGFVGKLTFSGGPPDTDPPTAQITSGPTAGATVTSASVTFGFSADEASTFKCGYDGESLTACGSGSSGSYNRTLSNGSHTFHLTATDAANNVSPEVTRTFTVNVSTPDTTPPQTTITSGPAAGSSTTDTTPTFGFSSSEAGSSFACRVDSGSFGSCSSPFTTSALSLGSHTFQVRATDSSGNTDASPDSRAFTVKAPTPPPDTTPPQTTITSAPKPTVKSKKLPVTVSFAFNSSEPGSTFSCKLDGAAAKPCSSPQSYELGKGEHTFSVVARDKAGNTDATPATATVKVKKKKKRKKK